VRATAFVSKKVALGQVSTVSGSLCTLLVSGLFTAPALAQTVEPFNTSRGLEVQLHDEAERALPSLLEIAGTVSQAGISQSQVVSQAQGFLKPTTAQQPQPTNFQSAQNNTQAQNTTTTSQNPPRFQTRAGVRYTSEGAGYEDGFTSFEGFFPITQTPGSNLTFAEGRFLLQNNSAIGFNALVGYRHFSESQDRVYGGYLAYDYRETGNNTFNQIGLGFETLANDFDLRINSYIPVGQTRQLVSSQNAGLSFSGNSLVFNTLQRFEAAAFVIDAEVGRELVPLGRSGSLRGYAGLYLVGAQGSPSVLGVKGRVEVLPTDSFNLGLSVQNDDLFDTRVVFSVGVNFPGSAPRGGTPISRNYNRMGESVVRNSAIVVADSNIEGQTVNVTQQAINAATGQPYRFLHVIAGGTGTAGTVEQPFGTVQAALAAAGNRDVVYIRGSGVETANALIVPPGVNILTNRLVTQTPDPVVQVGGPVNLPVNPVPLEPGAVYTINANSISTLQNSTVIGPNFNIAVVTLGNNSTVSDVTTTNSIAIAGNNSTVARAIINNPAGPGIQANGVNNLTLQNNTINNPQGVGINLINTTGNVNVTGNTVNGTAGVNSGFVLNNNAGNVNLNLANNSFNNTGSNGIVVSLTGTAVGNANITNSNASGNATFGLFLQAASTAQLTFNVANGSYTNNGTAPTTGGGISVLALDSSQINGTITGTTTSNNINGIGIQAGNTSSLRVLIENSTTTNNNQGGIAVGTFNNADAKVGVRFTTATGNGVADVRLVEFAPSALCVQPNGNTFGTAPQIVGAPDFPGACGF